MKRDVAGMVALVALGGVLAIAFGERIGINAGQGWDGISYTEWARDFARVLHDGLTHCLALRVGAVLAAAAGLGANLAARMQWSRAAAWAGFIALFGSFAVAKHATYYPALTDPTALALGMLMVWAYITDRQIALWCCAALGVVTWPALPPLALALLVFPRAQMADAGAPLDRRIALAAGAMAAAVFVGVAFHFLDHPVPGVGDEKFASWAPRGLLWRTVPLLVALIAAGIAFALAPVRARALVAYARALARRRFVIAVTAAILLIGLRALYLARVGTHGEGPTGAQFLCEHTLAALRGPLWGPVAHIVYFGPIIAVALECWRRVCAVAWSWGPAAVLALVLVVAFAAGSNSRQWNHLEPFLVDATIAATGAWWSPRLVLGFAVLALVWSKVWFHIGYDTVHDWHSFPNQRYFMIAGPYSTDSPYVVHLIATHTTDTQDTKAERARPRD